MDPRWIGTVAGRVNPSKVLLKLRHCEQEAVNIKMLRGKLEQIVLKQIVLVAADERVNFSVSYRRQLYGLPGSSSQTCATTYQLTRRPMRDRAFAAARQRLWNRLLAELRQPDFPLGRICSAGGYGAL